MSIRFLQFFLLIAAFLCTVISISCFSSNAMDLYTKSEFMMDTVVTIKVYDNSQMAKDAVARAFQRMRKVEEMASYHIATSELSLLNSKRIITPTHTFRRLMQASSWAFDVSEGLFDPTFSVLHQAYGFYNGKGRLPPSDEINEKLSLIGWNKQVFISSETISLASGAMLDMGGIAGGFAVEEAAEELRAAGCSTFFIDDGGDLWMEGNKPDGTPWRIAVKDPRTNGALAFIETREPLAISTSGDYERFIEVDGIRICHILIPDTGKSADYYRSVTVIASRPLAADVISTALFCMSPEKAKEFSEKNKIPALFLPASGTTWTNSLGKAWFKNITP